MPPKIATATVKKAATAATTATTAAVKKTLTTTTKKVLSIVHNFVAVEQVMPEKVDEQGNVIEYSFSDILEFYQNAFVKELCVSRSFMEDKVCQKYIINPRTGYPFDSYIRSFDFKNNSYNSIKIGDRVVCMTKFFDNEKFRNCIIEYYNKLGYNCEIYQTGFDKIKKRYARVCVKINF